MDSDFKERMFAKQMAVLKGQAFNVVETLKAGDQGPLELTRRTRMHVWDDEMDVPVAVPLRVPSIDARRSHTGRSRDLELGLEEEMDIGASAASAPTRSMPAANLFDLSTPTSVPNEDPFASRPSLETPHSFTSDIGFHPSPQHTRTKRPSPRDFRSSPLLSRSSLETGGGSRRSRRPSRGSGRGYSAVGGLEEFEDEGDLGFSVAEGLEGTGRKVIVERLEAVKGRNPVFSWC